MNKKVLIYGDGSKNKEVARLIAKCNSSAIIPIEEHDSELLNKVAEKLQEKICYENCGIRKCIFEKDKCPWYRCVNEVIAEIKEGMI